MNTCACDTPFSGVSVLVAAINETFSLQETVRIIAATCQPPDVREIVLVLSPTKSTAACIEAAERCVAETAAIPVSILWQHLPFAGGAYRDGFQAATGSHVIMMSADLETDPRLVCEMVAASRAHPDAVITMSRWMKGGGFTGYNRVKRWCNAIFQWSFALIFRTRLTDLTYAYRCFPLALMRAVDWRELRHPFFLETALVPLRLGTRFIELPAHWAPRREADSQNSFFANFTYIRTALRVRVTPRRRLLAHPPGSERRS